MGFTGLLAVALTFLCGVVGFIFLLLWKYPWLRYDFRILKAIIRVQFTLMSNQKKNKILVEEFEEKVQKHGQKIGLYFEDEKYTFEEMNRQINKVAHVGLRLGLKPGDIVCILIPNEPTFIWTYLGLAKIGVQIAFLNYNLRSKSLSHCFTVSGAKTLIIGKDKELVAAVEEIRNELNNNVAMYSWDDQKNLPSNFKSITQYFQDASTDNPDRNIRANVKYTDPLCYIYTSGTTGLPKAAVISHSRSLKAAHLLLMGGVTSEDILYMCLPLYHTSGSLAGLGPTLIQGTTLALRRKFSARNFFSDCVQYNVTVVQYIGELCRYLLATPPSANDKAHRVRLAFGNGLRKDIWEQFRERFNIPQIAEFYGATEGTAAFLNTYNKPGAVGMMTPLFRKVAKIEFVKYDYDTGEPLRDDSGFYIRAGKGEPGLLLTPVNKHMEFDGYKGRDDLAKKKILRDVFQKGDVYFNTGDLFILDKDYFMYFADRIGDTFRWKGENVSTVEVSNAVSELPWIEDANVYGVLVPDQDGRAGMAAITPVKQHKVTTENLQELFHHCSKSLPIYAIPRFLRIQAEMEITSTFKQRKVELVKEGFDPSKVTDSQLYYVDFSGKTYEPLNEEVFKAITEGKVRL